MKILTRNIARASSQRRRLPAGAALPARRGSVAVPGWANSLFSNFLFPQTVSLTHWCTLFDAMPFMTWIERNRGSAELECIHFWTTSSLSPFGCHHLFQDILIAICLL